MARRAAGASHLVERLDQAGAEEMRPQTVDQSAREIGVVGGGQPVGKYLSRGGAVVEVWLLAVEVFRLHHLVGAGDGQARLAGLLAYTGTPNSGKARLNVAEEGGEGPKLLLFPLREGVVVALSATKIDAEKEPGGRGCDFLGLVLLGDVENADRTACYHQTGRAGFGRGGDQLAHHRVEAALGCQPVPQPALEGGGLDAHLDVGARFRKEKSAPDGCKPGWIALPRQKCFDEALALVGSAIREEGARLADGGNSPRHVEVDPAKPFGVVGRFRRGHVRLFPGFLHQLIDAASEFVRAVISIDLRRLCRQRRTDEQRAEKAGP